MKYDNNLLFSRKKQRTTAIRYKPPEQDRVEYVRDQITDSDGLQRAYERGDTYVHGNTMYIAGSHTGKDWFDDFTKVPAHYITIHTSLLLLVTRWAALSL